MTLSCVMVAVDGSEHAAKAMALTASMVSTPDTELVVAHAVGLLEDQHLHTVDADGRAAEIEREVHSWCQPLRDRGVAYRVELVPGSPVPALLTLAQRVHADLLVVGHRGTGNTRAADLGSTSAGLVHAGQVPVLVVPG